MAHQCPYDNCSISMRRISDLRRHMNDKHLKCIVWECPWCPSRQKQSHNVVRHMRRCPSRPTEDDVAISHKPRCISDSREITLRYWNPVQPLPDNLKITSTATGPAEEPEEEDMLVDDD